MLTQEQALDIYKQTGAVLHGHFKLTSGRHSDTYMQSAKLFVQPAQAEKVCAALAEKLQNAGVNADMVISPAIGGILMRLCKGSYQARAGSGRRSRGGCFACGPQ